MVEIRFIKVAEQERTTVIAQRMRDTLVEVLGRERGEGMYSLAWLRERSLWHLQTHGCGIIAAFVEGEMEAHLMVRPEDDVSGGGLISTIYVAPQFRRRGIARSLVSSAEDWARSEGHRSLATYTDHENHRLIRLFTSLGYHCESKPDDFVRLSKVFEQSSG